MSSIQPNRHAELEGVAQGPPGLIAKASRGAELDDRSLGLSPNTVDAHVESAKTKLAANSRAQLVLRAVMARFARSDGY